MPLVAHRDFVRVAGPDLVTIETFSRVFGLAGPMPKETTEQLPFVMLRNITPVYLGIDGPRGLIAADLFRHVSPVLLFRRGGFQARGKAIR